MNKCRMRKCHPNLPRDDQSGSAYLSGLPDQGQTPPVFSAPAPQAPEVQHAATMAPRMDASLEIGTFPRLTTRPTVTNDQHELFNKFLKLKPPVFKGAESEDAYDFLVDCHELLHKMGIVGNLASNL